MNIVISNSSSEPLYEQIISQVKRQIISNELHEGDMLPSIRLLAKDLNVSIITTKRAYEELEAQGFICTVGGKGSFVASQNLELIKDMQLQEIEGLLDSAVRKAKLSGIAIEQLEQILEILYKED